MALQKCPECGKDVSSTVKACPNCGFVMKKKHGCLTAIGVLALIIVGLAIIGSQIDPKKGSQKTTDSGNSSQVSKNASQPAAVAGGSTEKPFEQGQSLSVGYTSYLVIRSWWSTRLSDNQFLNEDPNARFLFIELVVRNDDAKARTVPPFKLIDDSGAEYDTSDKSWAAEGALGIIENLNPTVSKQGFIVFDVPPGRNYKLKLSGGFWSGEDGYVRLTPQ